MPTIVSARKDIPAPAVTAPIPTPEKPPVAVAKPMIKFDSDLVQIETDHSKAVNPGQLSASSERHPPRRRQRQREVYVENEPLVQIETQHPR